MTAGIPGRCGAPARTRTLARALTLLLISALTFIGLTGAATPASAELAAPGVTASVSFPGSYDGTGMLTEDGAEGELSLSYKGSEVVPGSTIEIKLPSRVLPTNLVVPPGNTAVTSITHVDGVIRVTFADPFPGNVNQGQLDLKFKLDSIENSEKTTFEWSLNGATETVPVIYREKNDTFQDWTQNSAGKQGGGNLPGVSINGDQVVIAPAAANHMFDFTLVGTTKTAVANYAITDQLPAGMVYSSSSFSAVVETWDADGLNKTTTTVTPFAPTVSGSAAAGQSFATSLNVPANSRVTVKYQASFDASVLAGLRDGLQDLFPEDPDGQWISLAFQNTATLNGSADQTADVVVGVNVPTIRKPGVGTGTFNKTRDWNRQNIEPQADGSLVPPIPVTWTIKADLTSFVPPAGATATEVKYATLTENVVIKDALPAQARWVDVAAVFAAQGFNQVGTCSAATTPASFATTAAKSYCLSGNTLWINVGKDNTKSYTFALNAEITTVTGLTKTASGTVQGAFNYPLTNRAEFTAVTEGKTYTPGVNATVTMVDRPDDTGDSFNDTDTFKKEGPSQRITLEPGTTTKVGYTFTVNGNNSADLHPEVDAKDVKIVDVVDHEVFDISDLAGIKADLTGSYNGTSLTPADFVVSTNVDNELVIELSAAGKLKAVPANKTWTVLLKLPTKKVTGQQTIDISNTAELTGQNDKVLFWSEDVSTMTSFGSEAEVRKFVRDPAAKEWTKSLRAAVDGSGNLIQDTYVFQVEFIAHGTFKGKIFDVDDLMPAGTTFLGFVDAANVDTGSGASTASRNIGANITASYNAASRTMTLSSANVPTAARASAYFAVRIDSAIEDVPVMNRIGTVSATITPTNDYPLSVAKSNATNANAAINDDNARFELWNADGDVVVRDIFVRDNQLRVKENDIVKAVVVSDPGTYTLHEIVPPTGYVRSTEPLTIEVVAGKTPKAATFYNTPNPASVTVGDYVWIDRNHDGLQDASDRPVPTDRPVPGVELKIQKIAADGTTKTDVTGVNNMPVQNVTTAANGKYLFELLPVLAAGEKYEVTIVSKPATLDGYLPTTPGTSNGTGANDSSTASAVTVLDLTSGGKQDLTLDFGFAKPYVSVGDYVWIDVDRDGIQDAGEPGIEDVLLEVYGPDGQKVTTDVYGDPLPVVRTNASGKYLFDNLPPLTGNETYTVKIVKTDADTIAALAGLKPTDPEEGIDPAVDSSTWEATSTPGLLVTHEAHDPKLDFGFIREAVSVGDYVWEDVDRDGIQDAGEPGIEGVLLELFRSDGNGGLVKVTRDVNGALLPVVRTDEDGAYLFTGLPILPVGESYTVRINKTDADTVTALAPFVPTTEGDNGGDGADDSSTDSSASTADLSVDGSTDRTLDFGFVKTYVTVGDYVWIDLDRDGVQDAGEQAVEGVVLSLVKVLADDTTQAVVDVKGQPVGNATTNASGLYEFDLLPVLGAGEQYRVEIDADQLPSSLDNFIPTLPKEGADTDVDSETWTADSVKTLDGSVVPAQPKDSAHVGIDPSLDFGFVQKAVSVGNKVWFDADENGQRDPSEDPIEGVTLVLTGPDGNPVTDVYGDPVLPTVTGPNGEYTFNNLPALPSGEHYMVTIDYPNSPILEQMDLVPTNPGDRGGDTDPNNDYSHTDSATSGDLTDDGDRDPTLDFGFRKAKVSVGDYVWIDTNLDGLQDRTDVAIPGVVLVLTDPDGNPVVDVFGNPVGPQTTDAKGFYEFLDLPTLPAGKSYTVTIDMGASEQALKGLLPTAAGVGSDRAKDSSTSSAASIAVLSTDGVHDPTLDFGFIPATLSVITTAPKSVSAKVRADGEMRPVTLRDSVTIEGMAGRGTGEAMLYGPAPKRTTTMCQPGNLVGTVKFTAREGKITTPGIKVTEPGIYTWVVSVKGDNGQTGSHGCGLAAETTKVQRAAYGPIAIETGKRKDPGVAARKARRTTLAAPSIGLKGAPVRTVGIRKGEMVIPEGAADIGWLNRSAKFGDLIGTSVVAAHVSDTRDQPMAFSKLTKLRKGKIVTVTQGGKTYRYKVTTHKRYSRDRGPGIPKRFFRTDGAHRLVLVTCTDKVRTPTGGFHYSNNLVVIAEQIK
ncbi:SdrD B-like domain-containing protein [Nocardioides sp. Bht2]|uniref:SdrD B-like domain-containing protein n=1 Tax=Nocardioides sp. Bht2 TaxID=3392297 RepID=UPI0039B5A1A0